MKILIYKKWTEFPEGYNRPFKTIGSPAKNSGKNRHIANWLRLQKSPSLMIIKDKDYENCAEGTGEQLVSFMKDCMADLGIGYKERGSKNG